MLDVKLALIFLLLMYAIGPLFGCSTSPEPTTEAPAPPGKSYTYFCLISRENIYLSLRITKMIYLYYIYSNVVVTTIAPAGPISTITTKEPVSRTGKMYAKK